MVVPTTDKNSAGSSYKTATASTTSGALDSTSDKSGLLAFGQFNALALRIKTRDLRDGVWAPPASKDDLPARTDLASGTSGAGSLPTLVRVPFVPRFAFIPLQQGATLVSSSTYSLDSSTPSTLAVRVVNAGSQPLRAIDVQLALIFSGDLCPDSASPYSCTIGELKALNGCGGFCGKTTATCSFLVENSLGQPLNAGQCPVETDPGFIMPGETGVFFFSPKANSGLDAALTGSLTGAAENAPYITPGAIYLGGVRLDTSSGANGLSSFQSPDGCSVGTGGAGKQPADLSPANLVAAAAPTACTAAGTLGKGVAAGFPANSGFSAVGTSQLAQLIWEGMTPPSLSMAPSRFSVPTCAKGYIRSTKCADGTSGAVPCMSLCDACDENYYWFVADANKPEDGICKACPDKCTMPAGTLPKTSLPLEKDGPCTCPKKAA